MSSIYCCDICGKSQDNKKNIHISSEPIKLQIVNHKKEPYNVFVRVNIEPDKDTKKYNSLLNKLSNIRTEEDVKELYKEYSTSSDYTVNNNGVFVKLSNPEPHICDKCKRSLAELVLKYGTYEVITKF